jgi:hypothetical protein
MKLKTRKKKLHTTVTSGTLTHTVVIGPHEDLGSREPIIRRLGKRMAAHRRDGMRKWLGDSIKTAEYRQALLSCLSYRPEPVPFRERLVREEVLSHSRRRHYRIRISPDEEVGAILALPLDASPKHPVRALLGLHEHGGMLPLGREKLFDDLKLAQTFRAYQQRCYGDQLPGDFFAANGFAVFTIDQFGFGDRGYWHPKEDAAVINRRKVSRKADLALRLRMRYEQFWHHRALLAYGITESEISLHDNRRSIDFLETIPELDTTRGVGAFGLSVGCLWTHHLAAFDPRVTASVRVCWTGDLETMINADGPRALGVQFLLPGIGAHAHVPEMVALSDPSAVLIINGRKDSLYPFAAQERARRQIAEIAVAQGRQDQIRWSYFDGGHAFLPPQQIEALEFFRYFLGDAKHHDAARGSGNGELSR